MFYAASGIVNTSINKAYTVLRKDLSVGIKILYSFHVCPCAVKAFLLLILFFPNIKHHHHDSLTAQGNHPALRIFENGSVCIFGMRLDQN